MGGTLGIEKPRQAVLGNVAAPHHHQAGPCLGPQTIQWAGRPGKPVPPHTLQWRPQFSTNLTHWKETPGIQCQAQQAQAEASSHATRFLFGNSRCVRLVHAACKMGEYMLLMAGRYESSTDNALRRACACQTAICTTGVGQLHVNVPQYIHVLLQCSSLTLQRVTVVASVSASSSHREARQ